MIHSLEIKNIQSHEKAVLEFVDGINVIIGSSNQGKSAILRALYWLRTNRPLGIDNLASHWIVNDKGYLNDEMSVKVVNDKGVVERRRTKDENQYIVDGNVLNVVKTDIPVQVSTLLNLSDTNIQKQLDSPFLLSQTSGEVAKYFNQMVNLDVIDRVLTNTEVKRRKLKSTIETCADEIDRLEKKVEEFTWVDDVIDCIERHEGYKRKWDDNLDSLNLIGGLLNFYLGCNDKIDWIDASIGNVRHVLDEIESLSNDINDLDVRIDDLLHSIESFDSVEVYDFTSQRKLIGKIDFISNEIDDDSVIDGLCGLIDDYYEQVINMERQNEIVDEYKAKLPDVCPLCGSLLENGKCVSC